MNNMINLTAHPVSSRMPSIVIAQRPARVPSLQLVRAADSSDSKGFGSAPQPNKQSANKRGKVASRPGQLSRKDLEKRAQMRQEIEQQQPAITSSSGRPSPTQAPPDAVVPEVVTNRMLKRIVMFMGAPVLTGMLLLPGFYYLKVVQGLDVPTYVVYTVQSLTFGAGLLGISYGILSTSWDPRREGSLSGVTEFKANLPIVLDRFRRRV